MDLRPSLHDAVFVEHEDTAIRSFDRTGENAEDRAVFLWRVDVVEEPLRHFIKFFFTDADKGRNTGTDIFELLPLVIVQKHGV